MTVDKHTKIGTVLSIVVSSATVMGLVWVLVKPLITDAVADELKDEINTAVNSAVNAQLSPTNQGVRIMIQNTIAELEDDISRLEFRRDNSQVWAPEDAQELTNKRRRLRNAQSALLAMDRADRTN